MVLLSPERSFFVVVGEGILITGRLLLSNSICSLIWMRYAKEIPAPPRSNDTEWAHLSKFRCFVWSFAAWCALRSLKGIVDFEVQAANFSLFFVLIYYFILHVSVNAIRLRVSNKNFRFIYRLFNWKYMTVQWNNLILFNNFHWEKINYCYLKFRTMW